MAVESQSGQLVAPDIKQNKSSRKNRLAISFSGYILPLWRHPPFLICRVDTSDVRLCFTHHDQEGPYTNPGGVIYGEDYQRRVQQVEQERPVTLVRHQEEEIQRKKKNKKGG